MAAHIDGDDAVATRLKERTIALFAWPQRVQALFALGYIYPIMEIDDGAAVANEYVLLIIARRADRQRPAKLAILALKPGDDLKRAL